VIQLALRTGIIGTGYGTKVHAPILKAHPDFEVVAVASMRQGRAQEAAALLEIPAAFDNWLEMIQGVELDAVVIASNPAHHMEMTLAALDAGLHVICEKPPALNLSQAKAMMAKAAQVNTVSAMNFEWRYLPERQAIKRILNEGKLGQILHVNWHETWPMWPAIQDRPASWLWRTETGGGMLGAIGSHMIDSLHYWFGPLHQVVAVTENHVPFRPSVSGSEATDADDSFFFTGILRSGGTCTVQFHLSSVATSSRLEVYGTEGTLQLTQSELLFASRQDGVFQPVEKEPLMDASDFPDTIRTYVHPQYTFYTEFAHAVHGETANALPTLSDAAYVQAVIDAIRVSNHRSSVPVQVI
jgi:predicted dehydrogenase